MNAALDLGAHACRSLRGRGRALAVRRCRSLAALLADEPLPRTWLRKLGIPFFPADEFLALPGDHAEQLARVFPVACLDLLAEGKVPYSDVLARQLIALLVEAVLPAAVDVGEICCFTQPALRQADGRCDADFNRRMEFVTRLVRLRGYEPRALNPAAALVLAEMEREQFTGVGICLGASGCDLALAHRGTPIGALHVPRGGRWIDEELARRSKRFCIDPFGQRVHDIEAARRFKETLSIVDPASSEQRLVAEMYRQLMTDIAAGIERLLDGHRLLVKSLPPLTLVLGGGAAGMRGCEDLFRKEMARRLPGEFVGTIRREQTGELAVTRGCLIHATLESRARHERRMSA